MISKAVRQNFPNESGEPTFFCGQSLKNASSKKFRWSSRTLLPQHQHITMPPSQLKQLKASLRESGVLAPQQSKKQKRQNAKAGVSAQNRVQRNAALQAIRDRFNPFEIKVTSRNKFDVTTRDGGSKPATGLSRPGVTKSLGEEKVG
jgi:hypothetical protein